MRVALDPSETGFTAKILPSAGYMKIVATALVIPDGFERWVDKYGKSVWIKKYTGAASTLNFPSRI